MVADDEERALGDDDEPRTAGQHPNERDLTPSSIHPLSPPEIGELERRVAMRRLASAVAEVLFERELRRVSESTRRDSEAGARGGSSTSGQDKS
jgi:hypothetical protein